MSSRSIEMYEITVPIEVVKRLSDEERYSYYLLGHMFNELMALQKMVGFCLPKHDDRRPARLRPEISQSLFLFRMASSKIWEAVLKLRSKEISGVLQSSILPRMEGGSDRLKTLNVAINTAQWLSDLRNGLGFHFPSFAQWKPYMTPKDDWVDDSIFFGETTGNTFYDGADTVAQHWMFQQYGAVTTREAIDPLISEMIALLRITNTFLEDALGTFIAELLLIGNMQRRFVGKVMAQEHDRISIPFWTFPAMSKDDPSP